MVLDSSYDLKPGVPHLDRKMILVSIHASTFELLGLP